MTSVQLINIGDRNYTEWNIEYKEGEIDNDFCIDPALNKLFDGDLFKVSGKKVELLKSSIRTSKYICGILVLSQNKTFGKHKGKPLFKCIPGKNTLPMFLIPYEQKNSFSKNYKNKANI